MKSIKIHYIIIYCPVLNFALVSVYIECLVKVTKQRQEILEGATGRSPTNL